MQLLMGAGRRERDISGVFTTFWRRPIGLLDVIRGSLAFYLVQLTSLETGQVSYLLSSPWTRQSEEGFWNAPSPANWEKPARLTTHRLSLAREGWRKSGHHHECQFSTARSEDWAVPTKFWISAGKGSAPSPSLPCWNELFCTQNHGAPFTAEEKQSTKPRCSLELPSLSTGKPLKEVRKDHRSAWTEEVTSRCLFFSFFSFLFPLSYSMVIRNIVIKQQV